jgi:hypothetical protein
LISILGLFCTYIVVYIAAGIADNNNKLEIPANIDELFELLIILIGSALFWPNVRFILMPTTKVEARSDVYSVSDESFLGWARTGARHAMTSAWWFALLLFAGSLRYVFSGFDVEVALLTMPLAILAGWLCGGGAITPVLVGSVPFVAEMQFSPTITTPGGLWPIVVLPMLTRIFADASLRDQILGRARASLWDCALFIFCLASATPILRIDSGLAFTVDPTWLATAVGFVFGASRMRGNELIVALAAFAASGTLIGLHDAAQLSSLSAASFFGGRIWRGVALERPAGLRGIDARLAAILMAALVGSVFFESLLSWTSNSHPGPAVDSAFVEASFALLAFVAGIVFRKSPRLSLATVAIGLGTAGISLVTSGATIFGLDRGLWFSLDGGFWSSLACIGAFALLGHEIDRRGDAAYARTFGVFLDDKRRPPDHAAVVAAA